MCIKFATYFFACSEHPSIVTQNCLNWRVCYADESSNIARIPIRNLQSQTPCPTCTGNPTASQPSVPANTPGIPPAVIGPRVLSATERFTLIEQTKKRLDPANFRSWLWTFCRNESLLRIGLIGGPRNVEEANQYAQTQELGYWQQAVQADPSRLEDAPDWVRVRVRAYRALVGQQVGQEQQRGRRR
ncbi:hypothetical protein KVT40_006519 [Elsinoe batatas]|uniref:Uncharacterized protein n=1 Tax=Elsinoe batatas TaxID=2601811 RepID=A0A8K0L0S8_9PEZI|nr:hypothetical protein KVT40_006519 [Elsinoe batatas]